jgi:hypothetical protein
MIKSLLSLCLLLILLSTAHAQMGFNSPAGILPRQDVEAYTRNGFLVQQKYRYTTVDPATTLLALQCPAPGGYANETAGIIQYPTGGGNYAASQNCGRRVNGVGTGTPIGYEIVFEALNTESTDGLVIGDRVYITTPEGSTLVYSGSTLPAPIYISSYEFGVQFVSNSNATVGTGFRLRWRQIYTDLSASFTPNTPFGNALFFDAQRGALVSGALKTGFLGLTGNYSTALGNKNIASGVNATALGYGNTASEFYATAFGDRNIADGQAATTFGSSNTATAESATAFGSQNLANDNYATAFGRQNTASGISSLATGYLNIASGNFSTAMGHRMNTNNQAGAFMIGDTDPLGQGTTLAGSPDQFVARFRNGYYLMTSGSANNTTRTGVVIGAGQNAWSAISDSTRKERFVPMNHSEVLRKINAMQLTSWNYKGQREIRHYGPMAQDFYAAFGHDALGPIGCDTLINSHDFAGVTFAGVQALIRENETLKTELKRSQAETQNLASLLAQQKTENTQIQADFSNRLHLLERAMLTRRERVTMRKAKP